MENTVYINSGRACFEVYCGANGAASACLERGFLLSSDCREPLFRLLLRNTTDFTETEMTSLEGWDGVLSEKNGSGAAFTFKCEGQGLLVKLNAECDEKNDCVSWTVELENTSPEYAVVWLEYPQLCYKTDENACLFHPHGSGALLRGWPGTEAKRRDEYPASAACMQFMALTDEACGESVYYGVHDPGASFKVFSYEKEKDSPVLRLYARYFCENSGSPGNSQRLPGELVMRAYCGDWYDAAMIYSEFVEKYATWLPRLENGARKDTPDWIRDTTHWWLASVGDDESYVDVILKAQAELSCRSSLHIYTWHEIPFDNDYPHYFPAKKHFLESFKRLQSAGIKVMPYINGRLWDTRDKKAEDFMFSSVAKPGAAKKFNGEPVTEKYGSKEEDGSPVELAVMCPTSPVWVEKQKELVGRLLNEVGVDAVYIDQIASAPPVLCFDAEHKHPTGGGDWWVGAYHRLLTEVSSVMPRGTALTTESTAEPFIDILQGCLSWDSVFDGQVPAFTAVYSRYVIAFGRNFGVSDDDTLFAVAAQSLLWGEQLGWISPDRYLAIEKREFYNEIVKIREELYDFFVGGRLLRPPHVKSGAKPIKGETMRGAFKSEAVLSGLWESRAGRKALIIVNISQEEQSCEISSQYINGIPAFEARLNAHLEDGALCLTLPARSVVYAVLD